MVKGDNKTRPIILLLIFCKDKRFQNELVSEFDKSILSIESHDLIPDRT